MRPLLKFLPPVLALPSLCMMYYNSLMNEILYSGIWFWLMVFITTLGIKWRQLFNLLLGKVSGRFYYSKINCVVEDDSEIWIILCSPCIGIIGVYYHIPVIGIRTWFILDRYSFPLSWILFYISETSSHYVAQGRDRHWTCDLFLC